MLCLSRCLALNSMENAKENEIMNVDDAEPVSHCTFSPPTLDALFNKGRCACRRDGEGERFHWNCSHGSVWGVRRMIFSHFAYIANCEALSVFCACFAFSWNSNFVTRASFVSEWDFAPRGKTVAICTNNQRAQVEEEDEECGCCVKKTWISGNERVLLLPLYFPCNIREGDFLAGSHI